MELHIITPSKQRTILINWIEINTPAGNMVIQERHTPMIIAITPSSKCLFAHQDGVNESLVVPQGIVEIEQMKVSLIMHDE